METQTIPETRWNDFLNQFSKDYLDRPITIEVLAEELGPQFVAQDLPFQGISFDTKGTRPAALQIQAGDGLSRHVNHVVEMPLYIRQLEGPTGGIDLQIEPAARTCYADSHGRGCSLTQTLFQAEDDMQEMTFNFRELKMIAGTRVLLGVGIGLLIANHLTPEQRRTAGKTLVVAGAVTTIPLALEVLRQRRQAMREARMSHVRRAEPVLGL